MDYPKVYVVEWRQRAYVDLDDAVLVHVASSLEGAIAWSRANLTYEEQDPVRPWLFAITEEAVDDPDSQTALVAWVAWDGTITDDAEGAPAYYHSVPAPGRASSLPVTT
jgi:hypothetical protein